MKKKNSIIVTFVLLPKAIPSAAACTTRPNVAVHVDLDFDVTEPDESRTN
jgi:hypothetical protein